jgi:hypothetical protein
VKASSRRRGLLLALVVTALAVVSMTPATAQTAAPLTDANGVPVGVTPPVIGSAPARPHSILAFGDSDLGQALYHVSDVLAQHGFTVPVRDAHANGWGLLDPLDGMSALDVLAQRLEQYPDVDTVVIGFVGACPVACGPGKLAYGSQQFYDAWDAAARNLVTSARARGLQVIWAVAPPAAPAPTADPPVEDWFSLPMRHQVGTTLIDHARAYRDEFGIATVDFAQALADTNGQWQQELSYGGAVHTVRLDDKVHLSDDGSLRTSAWITATLMQLWTRPQTESVV